MRVKERIISTEGVIEHHAVVGMYALRQWGPRDIPQAQHAVFEIQRGNVEEQLRRFQDLRSG